MRRSLLPVLVLVPVVSLFAGCKKDPPPPPPVVETPPAPTATAPVELAPLVEDAGADAAEAGVKKAGGGGNTAASRMKQCCNALRAQAKGLGPSPEAAQLTSIAAICDQAASGNSPELAPLKALMTGKAVPPICQF